MDDSYIHIPYLGLRTCNLITSLKSYVGDKLKKPKFYHKLVKLKSKLHPRRDPEDPMECNNVVYGYFCAASEKCLYVGMTERLLKVRVKEHKIPPSPIHHHIIACNICADSVFKDMFRILDRGYNKQELLIREAIQITKYVPSLNTQNDSFRLVI